MQRNLFVTIGALLIVVSVRAETPPEPEPIEVDVTMLRISHDALRDADPTVVQKWRAFRENPGDMRAAQSLREAGLAKLVAEPRLITLSGRRARFVSGGSQALPTGDGGKVELVPFGTILSVLPKALDSGKIDLECQIERSAPSENGQMIGRTVERVSSHLEVDDGKAVILGGLTEHRVESSTCGVWLPSDLPCIGPLFTSTEHRETETELVVVVVARRVPPDGE